MKKMERLVGIIYALKENKRLTAKEIADIFEVGVRTVYRDIDALCQLKIPIQAFEGHDGGYEIDENYFLPSLSLIENEILYLLICLKLGDIIKIPNMKADYQSLKYKLLNILDTDKKEKHMKVLERISFDINRMFLEDYRQDVTEKIVGSFNEYKDLVIEYYSPKKDVCIERKVTPYEIEFFSGGWYLVGYCHLRKAKRVFRLDRIKDIRKSNDTYSPSIINEYLKRTEKKSEGVKVTLEMNKRLFQVVKNDNIFSDVKTKDLDDIVVLQFYTDRLDDIVKFAIRNLGAVKIIEPQECIDKLKQISKNISEIYL